MLSIVACKGGGPSGERGAAKDSPSVSASGVPSETPPVPAAATSVQVAGSYDAKVGAVRTPPDVAPFVDETTTALGTGDLDLTLPATSGEVSGQSHGALGELVFSGDLAEGRLTGSLWPKDNAGPGMRGVVDATVEGAGDARVVSGTIRASGFDGTVVREASFSLKKK